MDDNQILILGGGFAGLFTAMHLSSSNCPLPITLIDRETRFIFKPLLYELLSNEVAVNVAWPRYEELLADRDVTYILGNIQTIDLKNRQVTLKSGLTYGYRYLVIALGDTAAYFGVPGAEEHAFKFRTAEDALELGKHLRRNLQKAVQESDVQKRRSLLTSVIVGAGPSGVELAATLADLLPQWYEELGGDIEELRVVLLQRGTDILTGGTSDSLRNTAKDSLAERRIPVELQLHTTVQDVTAHALTGERDGESQAIEAATMLWTAGSKTNPLIDTLPIPDVHKDHRGRPYLTSTLRLIDFPEVFAGGDCAVEVESPQPTTAQVAYQQGRAIARHISALLNDDTPKPIDITSRGTLMKLGIEESVAELLGQVKVSGYAGHMLRQATYLSLLPTPARNLKLGTHWITDEVYGQFLGV